MGRRTTSTTKGGRYMNPADQERKMARKRELKKNKRQRLIVRQAVLKSKDPEDILSQMEKLDRMEFDPNNLPALPERVIQEKRQKLRETYLRVMGMHKRENESQKFNELKKKIQEYDGQKSQLEQNYAAVKFAREANPAEIPLPDGAAAPGAAMTPMISMPGGSAAFPAHMIMSSAGQIHGILKKAGKPRFEEPPGPPCGIPQDFSDSEDDDDDDDDEEEGEYEEDDDEEGMERGARVRFEGIGEHEKDSRSRYKELARKIASGDRLSFDDDDSLPPGLRGPRLNVAVFPPAPTGSRLMRPPPPPPGLPPGIMTMNRMPQLIAPGMGVGIRPRAPIGPQLGPSLPPPNPAVISAAPTITRRSMGPVIEAKPQLRNMQQEVTKLVPTAVKVRRDVQQKKPPRTQGQSQGSGVLSGVESSGRSGVAPQQKSTDTAYEQFMKEMSGIL